MDLEAIRSVFEFVLHVMDGSGQLSGLSNRNESGRQGLGDRGAEDETARLGPQDEVNALASKGVDHEFDRESERGGIGQEGCEVLEHDAGLGKIRHVSDEGEQLVVHVLDLVGLSVGCTGGARIAVARLAYLGRTYGPDSALIREGADWMAQARSAKRIETVEPIGARVLIRKDEDKKQTKAGLHLPDKMEIPTLTGRVVAISSQVASDEDYPVRQYQRVLFHPGKAIPVDFEGDNRLFVVPITDVVAVFRAAGDDTDAEGGA